MRRLAMCVLVVAIAALAATGAAAQPAAARPAEGKPEDGAEAYGEMLRRTDPEAYARYVRLREARDSSLSELMRAQERYRAGGPELRALSLPPLRAARRKYAADELDFLDFLDERDRTMLEQYRGAIEHINGILAERARAREELKDLVKE
jgi:hypothetical protein